MSVHLPESLGTVVGRMEASQCEARAPFIVHEGSNLPVGETLDILFVSCTVFFFLTQVSGFSCEIISQPYSPSSWSAKNIL